MERSHRGVRTLSESLRSSLKVFLSAVKSKYFHLPFKRFWIASAYCNYVNRLSAQNEVVQNHWRQICTLQKMKEAGFHPCFELGINEEMWQGRISQGASWSMLFMPQLPGSGLCSRTAWEGSSFALLPLDDIWPAVFADTAKHILNYWQTAAAGSPVSANWQNILLFLIGGFSHTILSCGTAAKQLPASEISDIK